MSTRPNLQATLQAKGYTMPYVSAHGPSGIFAGQTKAAVERFQMANNLSVTGMVDSVTHAKLFGGAGLAG